ncbi:MAG: chemotaxis protein CheA [Candidatus Riflebacteria bacterium]|nr:chemotaxis protein CheA [Candidatus Riflebacteria bacterium]
MDQYQSSFREDSKELLSELETALIELEAAPDDKSLVERAFRALHTIKGNSRVVGFEEIGAFVHRLESVFDQVRRELIEFTPTLGNLTLSAIDNIHAMVESHFGGPAPDPSVTESLLSLVDAHAPGSVKQSQSRKGEEIYKALDKLIARFGDWASLANDPGLPAEFGDRFFSLQEKFSPIAADLAEFAGQFSLAFRQVISLKGQIEEPLIALSREAVDHMRNSLKEALEGPSLENLDPMAIMASMERPMLLLGRLKTLVPFDASQTPAAADDRQGRDVEETYRIRFRPIPDFLKNGGDPIALLADLSVLGRVSSLVQPAETPLLQTLDPEQMFMWWDIIITSNRGKRAIEDTFLILEGQANITVEVITKDALPDDPTFSRKLGEILVDRGDVDPEKLNGLLGMKKPLGETLVERGLVTQGQVQAALTEQSVGAKARMDRRQSETTSHLRVSLEKLDRLVGFIGELVTVEARLSSAATSREDADLIFVSEEMNRLTERLRVSYMQIRMQPIGITFYKFTRMVRDLAAELGKEVELTTDGAETELDKATIEKLNDPLVHLIRNCVDHGIESPHIRTAAGKPAKGTVNLSAEHSAGNVFIRVRDDGGGLHAEAIRSKAIEKKLISPEAVLTENEMYHLIFQPGFSTAQKVTNVSGRGSGLDVVQNAINELHGSIAIKTTIGQGTTFTFKLPLTLAIIDGLLVGVSDRLFVFPLSSVRECVDNGFQERVIERGRGMATIRGELVPFISLRSEFLIPSAADAGQIMVVVQSGSQRLGVIVDRIIGLHQTVLKPLGSWYENVKAFSGSTILGDGTVALVIDHEHLLAMAASRSDLDMTTP